jgi:hypothetical protein
MIVVYLSTGKEEVIWAYGSTRHAKLYRKAGQRPKILPKKQNENISGK